MNKDKKLTILKKGHTRYPESPEQARLETFENPSPSNKYTVEFSTEEFTSLCPVTSQPDFGKINIEYIPDKKCIESKSLKLYLFSYRNYQGFVEKITNKILDDIVKACSPLYARVTGIFNPRGGIGIKVEADYNKERKSK
ncbi:MAG: preQ(1) synthase [Elusimicrobiota bacterium]